MTSHRIPLAICAGKMLAAIFLSAVVGCDDGISVQDSAEDTSVDLNLGNSTFLPVDPVENSQSEAPNQPRSIIGSWETSDQNGTFNIVFTPDGTCVYSADAFGIKSFGTGRYILHGGGAKCTAELLSTSDNSTFTTQYTNYFRIRSADSLICSGDRVWRRSAK